jgi:hypothetical protein
VSLGGPAPSTLSDVLRYVVALYTQAGLVRTNPADPATGIEILTGERYDRQEGAPPRLFFRPDKQGRMGPVRELTGRSVGTWTHGCNVYAWGAETAADLDRYDAAIALAMQVRAALHLAVAARGGAFEVVRADETSLVTFGEDYMFRFEYTWDIPRDDALERAALALAQANGYSQSPTDPDRPHGPTPQTFSVNVVSQNAR